MDEACFQQALDEAERWTVNGTCTSRFTENGSRFTSFELSMDETKCWTVDVVLVSDSRPLGLSRLLSLINGYLNIFTEIFTIIMQKTVNNPPRTSFVLAAASEDFMNSCIFFVEEV